MNLLQLKALNAALAEINKVIEDEKTFLKDYINKKDEFYIKLRAKRDNS